MLFFWCVFRARQLWRCTVTTKSSVHSARCRKPCDCAGIHRTWPWNAAVWLSEWSSAPVGSVQQAHWKVIWCSWWQASALPEIRGCIKETTDPGQRWLFQVLEKQRTCLWARWYILYQAVSFFLFCVLWKPLMMLFRLWLGLVIAAVGWKTATSLSKSKMARTKL